MSQKILVIINCIFCYINMYAVKLEIFRVDCSHGFRLVRHVTQRLLLIFTEGNAYKHIQFCLEFFIFSLWHFFYHDAVFQVHTFLSTRTTTTCNCAQYSVILKHRLLNLFSTPSILMYNLICVSKHKKRLRRK